MGLDLSAALAGWLGLQSADRLTLWNVAFVVGATWKFSWWAVMNIAF